MVSKLRKHPLICLLLSAFCLLVGRLRLKRLYIKSMIKMDDDSAFQIFRYISRENIDINQNHTVFILKFKFSQLSFKANKLTSIIPMLLITGFPGFQKKIFCVNHLNGYWQGMYQWANLECLEEYKKSLVFRVMNKRAIPESISTEHFVDSDLDPFVKDRLIK